MLLAQGVVFGLFGLIIGSFLNVLILRRGARTIAGRSGCLACRHTLAWYDLVPVVSWVTLSGRCRYCGSSISIQYPLVEAATAILFALIGGAPSDMSIGTLVVRGVFCIIAALFVLIAAYDIRHTIIPDGWVWTLDAIAFALVVVALPLGGSFDIGAYLAGPLVALPLFLLWFVSRGAWMGLGDAKLALGMGWLVGLAGGFIALLASFVIGAAVSVGIIIPFQYVRAQLRITRLGQPKKPFTMKSEVPFGPFLVAGTCIVWIAMMYGVDLPSFFML